MDIYEKFDLITGGKLKLSFEHDTVVIKKNTKDNSFEGIIFGKDYLKLEYKNNNKLEAKIILEDNSLEVIRTYNELYDEDDFVFEKNKFKVTKYRLNSEDEEYNYVLPEKFKNIPFFVPKNTDIIINSISFHDPFYGEVSHDNDNQLIIRKYDNDIKFLCTENGAETGYSFRIEKDYIYADYFEKHGKFSFSVEITKNFEVFVEHFILANSFYESLAIKNKKITLNIQENSKMNNYELIEDITNKSGTFEIMKSSKENETKKEIKIEDNTNKSITKKELDDIFHSLDDLVGLDDIKDELYSTCALAIKNRKYRPNLHMALLGNPGTGKTEVGKRIASLFYKAGILPTDHFNRVTRENLVGEFIGKTEKRVKTIVEESMGGVLFIDEAYNLYREDDTRHDYGLKAIDVLVNMLEEYQGKFCCIFAGYPLEMETFFSANPGLNSRVPNKIFFGDYSNNELIQICKNLLKDKKYVADANVVKEVVKIVENKRNRKDFANAREVRNVLEQLYRIQARRTIDCEEDRTLTLEDIEIYKNKNKDKTKIIK